MMKKLIIAMAVVCALALAFYAVKSYRENARTNVPGFAHGNGRLEATEVAVATKLAGKVEAVYAKEGALVKKGDKLGKIIYTINGITVREVDVIASDDVYEKKKNGRLFGIF